MNRDSIYSLIFIGSLLIYAILVRTQVKRMIQDKRYRKPWITGGIILSGVICLLGVLTPINIAGAISAAILIMLFLNVRGKISIKKLRTYK